jgi:hypothetical protein
MCSMAGNDGELSEVFGQKKGRKSSARSGLGYIMIAKHSHMTQFVAVRYSSTAHPPLGLTMLMMTFEQWWKRFEQSLRVGTPAWKAFQAWSQHIVEFQRSASQMPKWNVVRRPSPGGSPLSPFTAAPKTYIAHSLYHGTLPQSDETRKRKKEQKKQDRYALRELDELATHAEEFVAHLSKREPWVATDDDYFCVDLTPLLQVYGGAAQSSRRALSLLQIPYLHNPDVLDRCLPLIAHLTRRRHRVPEPQALALIYSALLAHGHNPEDLASFDPPKFRNGNVRKRLDSRTRRVIAMANVISAHTRKK